LDRKEEFLVCLRALARIVQHQWYSDKSEQLKTAEGIFDWFITTLLDQSITPEQHFRTVNGLRKSGWMNYETLINLLRSEPDKLKTDLREALKSYRFPNRAVKAIILNVEKIQREYEGNLHNIFHFSKDTSEVWRRINNFYWFKTKKAGVFIRELASQGLWKLDMSAVPIPPDSRVRRVLFRLGFVKNRNDVKEIAEAAKKLSKEAKITPLDLDCVLWAVGDICEEGKPICGKCPLDFYCPSFNFFKSSL